MNPSYPPVSWKCWAPNGTSSKHDHWPIQHKNNFQKVITFCVEVCTGGPVPRRKFEYQTWSLTGNSALHYWMNQTCDPLENDCLFLIGCIERPIWCVTFIFDMIETFDGTRMMKCQALVVFATPSALPVLNVRFVWLWSPLVLTLTTHLLSDFAVVWKNMWLIQRWTSSWNWSIVVNNCSGGSIVYWCQHFRYEVVNCLQKVLEIANWNLKCADAVQPILTVLQ